MSTPTTCNPAEPPIEELIDLFLSPDERELIKRKPSLGNLLLNPDNLKRYIESQLLRLGNGLHASQGQRMLELSRKMARTTEKTWFMITVNLTDWKRRLTEKRLPVRAIMSANSWQTEHIPSMLDMLYSMDSDTEYMLSIELYDTETSTTVYSCAMIPTRNPQLQTSPSVPLECQFIYDPEGAMFQRHCHTCMRVGCKLYRCQSCRVQRYCSNECQKKDWKDHKKVCTILNSLRTQRNLESLD
jgi:hypothetical protein